MYNQPFFMPGYLQQPLGVGAIRGLGGGLSAAPGIANAGRGASLFGRLGSAMGALRGFNWGGLINNTSKTLGIINQTIPLVRQVGPMVGNMRSILKIASVFKDETDENYTTNNNSNNNTKNYSNNNSSKYKNSQNNNYPNKKEETIEYQNSNDSPVFFIN